MSLARVDRLLGGRPLPTSAHAKERLSKAATLAVLCSDALPSVAYATEETLLVLVASLQKCSRLHSLLTTLVQLAL
jgi:hypothetical protein